MSQIEFLQQLHRAGRIGRRELLGRISALGASAAVLTSVIASEDAHAAETPRKGGTMRLGIGGGSTTDSLEPSTCNDSVGTTGGFAFLEPLIETGVGNKPEAGLAASWEAKAGASEWVFNLQKGVTFHNGKTFTADDAVFSLNMHRGKTKSGAAGAFAGITDVKKTGEYQITITLKSGDAEFPMVLTDYHARMVPEGTTDFSKATGTGAFTLGGYQPGVRVQGKKFANYWRRDRGFLDAFDLTVINDSTARLNALMSGQVDAINRVDAKVAGLIKSKKDFELVVSPGGRHTVISLLQDPGAMFENHDLRLAMKYGIDREQVVKTLMGGYGNVGMDHPIPRGDANYNTNLKPVAYDPEKAKFHLKKSGFAGNVVIQSSEAAFSGAVDMATLFQANLVKAGMKIDVKKEPADGFWSNVWLKGNCVVSYWAGRTTATQMLDVAYGPTAPWNESRYRNPKFAALLNAARAELDAGKRKTILFEAQALMADDVAALIPAFRNSLDAHNSKVGGHVPSSLSDMDNSAITLRGWMKA